MFSFMINWDSDVSVGHWAYLFDYSGFLDFVVGGLLLYALVKRFNDSKARKVEIWCGIISLIAGFCWVVDGKLNHRLSFLQQKAADDQISQQKAKIDALEEKARPRHLTQEMIRKLIGSFSRLDKPAGVHLGCPINDAEAADFTMELSSLFIKSGYTNVDKALLPPPLRDGLTLVYPTNLVPSKIVSSWAALTNLGFSGAFETDARSEENVMTIYVGKKP